MKNLSTPISDAEFASQHVVITGGTGFLGSAITERLLASQAICHVTWVLDEERERFSLANRVTMHRVDCTDENAVKALYQHLPQLDASIHVVGGFAMAPVEQTSARDFDAMYRLNALTTFLCSKAAIAKMRAGKAGGRIVNIAARPAIAPVGGMVAYSTAKAAVASLTQCLADEVKSDNILINAILPSIMDTQANRQAMPNAKFDEWPKLHEVAETVAYLASQRNALTSGALVPVFGRA